MKKNLFKEIKIPEGVEMNIEKNVLVVKGKEGEVKKKFDVTNLTFEKIDDKIRIGNKKSTKKEKKKMNTIERHIKNMIKGVQKKFEYKLKICFSHFPITVEIKGNEAIIKNFLGEKVPRKTRVLDGTEVKVNKDMIIVTSANKELAGQTAANFENITKISARDRRIFQDGIFMTNKAGKEI